MTMNKISESDLGWLAAIMDAKGKITTKTNPTRNTPQLVLRVCTTDKRIAERLSQLTGTSPEPHEFTRFSGDMIRKGCKEHCPEPHIHVEEPLESLPQGTEWRLTGLSMAIVLWNLRKYMTRYPDFAGYVGVAYRNAVTTGRGSGQVRASRETSAGTGVAYPCEDHTGTNVGGNSWRTPQRGVKRRI